MAVADWDEETKDEPDQQLIEISYDTTDRDWSKGWKLYYWQGFGGRGQYIRVMLEFCGVEWQEALKDIKFEYGDEQDKSVKAMVAAIDKVRQKGDNKTAFAVPILTHNDDFILSQCGAIVLFLAELFPNLKPLESTANGQRHSDDDASDRRSGRGPYCITPGAYSQIIFYPKRSSR